MAIQFLRGTKSAITAENPVLLAGQPCVELDTGQLKIGNGSTAYNSLPYVGDGAGGSSIYYGSSTTVAATAAKVTTISDFKLETGVMVIIKFTITNTATNPTLNISGTGAKAIKYNDKNFKDLFKNSSYLMRYNGTSYDIICGLSGEIRGSDSEYVSISSENGTLNVRTRAYYAAGTNTAALRVGNVSSSGVEDSINDLYLLGSVGANSTDLVNLHIKSLSLADDNSLIGPTLEYDSTIDAIKITF